MSFIFSEKQITSYSNSLHFGPVIDIIENLSTTSPYPLQILDIGCASGAFEAMLEKRRISNYQYTGLDLSIDNLSAGRKHYKIQRMVQGDCFNLPFCPNSFDLVVAMGILYTLPAPASAFAELFRVCKNTCIVNMLGVPAGTNSEYRRGTKGENHLISLLNPPHWKDFLKTHNIPLPHKSWAWTVPTNKKGTHPVYRGSDYRLEWIHLWKVSHA